MMLRISTTILNGMNTQLTLEPVAGTRDFLPADMAVLEYIIGVWNRVCEKYAFEEYGSSPIERIDLWKRKNESGEEDIGKEMFVVRDTLDESESPKHVLRPEMTPTLVRMIQQIRAASILPLKWYSVPLPSLNRLDPVMLRSGTLKNSESKFA